MKTLKKIYKHQWESTKTIIINDYKFIDLVNIPTFLQC